MGFRKASNFFFVCLAWKICGVQKKHNLIVENENDLLKDTDGCEDETIDETVLILRNKVMLLLEMCFEQFVDSDLNICCMAQVKFEDTVPNIQITVPFPVVNCLQVTTPYT